MTKITLLSDWELTLFPLGNNNKKEKNNPHKNKKNNLISHRRGLPQGCENQCVIKVKLDEKWRESLSMTTTSHEQSIIATEEINQSRRSKADMRKMYVTNRK